MIMANVPFPRQIEGTGTPATVWHLSPQLAAVPTVPLAQLLPGGGRLLVIAPHPDDEVLGCGGLLQLCAAAGRAALLVAVTDGTGSHPGSTLWPVHRLAAARPAETLAALRVLGMPDLPVHRLGLSDGSVAAHEQELQHLLENLLQPGDTLCATWQLDGHPDHEGTGRAAAAAALAAGATCIEMPVWGWHWAAPDDPRLPWQRAVRLAIPPSMVARKRAALACFASQIAPDASTGKAAIVPPSASARLLTDHEVFFL